MFNCYTFTICHQKIMRVAVFRKANFNAAHQLYNDNWSKEKNFEVFGPCANPNFHGHNYNLEVKVVGEVDQSTGMVIDLKLLKNIIKDEIEDRFDHKNLNLDTEEFKSLLPSAENLAVVIHNLLSKRLDKNLELTVRLYETERNFVEYPA